MNPEEQRFLGVGVKIRRRTQSHLRHAAALDAHAEALVRGFSDPLPDVVAARLARLRERMWASPFWRERLRAHGLSPDDLSDLEALSGFPTLSREDVGRALQDLPALDEDDPDLHVVTSSGSTGKALRIVRSGYDTLHTWAALRFWLARHAVTLPDRPRVVLLCTLPGGLEYSTRLPHFAGGALHRISTLKPRPVERLRKASPAVISTDPAGLHWLSAHPEAADGVRLVISGAQHLPASERARHEATLGAPIVNYYATVETGPIAWQCCAGRDAGATSAFHVLHPDVHVASEGGQLVVTRLRDSAVPLVRYLPGDAGTVADGACACGFVGRSVTGFTGRRACHFVRPDGALVDGWSLAWLFKDLPLVGFVLTQTGSSAFLLELEPDLPMPAETFRERLRIALGRLGWASPEIETSIGPLPPQPRKPEPFRRRYNPPP
jgi:phenylacetate-CoA ligase